MDSKLMRIAMLLVTLFIGTVFVIILLINGVGSKKKSVPAIEPATIQETEETADDGMLKDADLSAWMNDETFFDQKKLHTLEMLEAQKNTLYLTASSVEKDLRIRIVDYEGNLVTGHTFVVDLNGEGQYKDVDRDGVIYIGDMKPGEYQVTLQETAGFLVSQEPLPVSVKAQIEYLAIDDISYLIKTEDEIDPAKEDTAVNDAADGSATNNAIRTQKGAVFGIDVSRWNQEIDWEQVAKEGVSFAMIRAGYRGSSSGSLIEDSCFEQNVQGATENGIPVGIYFFTQAVNEVEAVEEASMVLSLIEKYDISYPVIIDTEGAGGNGRADNLDVAARSKICEAFCQTIRSQNYQAGVYASRNWLNKKIDITKLSADNVIWLAEYRDEPSYGGDYQMWQYTSSGRINGIEGRVDFNLSYLAVEENNQEKENSKDNNEDPVQAEQ